MQRSKPIKRKAPIARSRTPLKKSGETKRKKVIRQKAFYASAVWKRMRKEALERAGNQCEYVEVDMLYTRCEANWYCSKMHVHHKTNARFGGDELPSDLIAYCEYHHRFVEARDFPTRHR